MGCSLEAASHKARWNPGQRRFWKRAVMMRGVRVWRLLVDQQAYSAIKLWWYHRIQLKHSHTI